MNRTSAGTMLLMALLGLASCTASPRTLGITGPGAAPGAPSAAASAMPSVVQSPGAPGNAAALNDDAAIQPPGTPTDFGARYAPSLNPTYGSDGRFYGYN